jgi:bacillithiol system protein YtxJ
MANFIELNSLEKLEELFEKSNETPVILFKHSITCPISSGVYHEVSEVEGEVNLVIVQTARQISNEIASKTGVRHESPQAIVLKNGKAVYHASHYDITSDDLNGQLTTENGQWKIENG